MRNHNLIEMLGTVVGDRSMRINEVVDTVVGYWSTRTNEMVGTVVGDRSKSTRIRDNCHGGENIFVMVRISLATGFQWPRKPVKFREKIAKNP